MEANVTIETVTLEDAITPPSPQHETTTSRPRDMPSIFSTRVEVSATGERAQVEEHTYDLEGEMVTSTRRIPINDPQPDKRELEYAAIKRDDGEACARLCVDLAYDIGVTFMRAREILSITSDDYRQALTAYVEARRAAVKARRAALTERRDEELLVERVRAAEARLQATDHMLVALTERRKRADRMRGVGGRATDERELERLRDLLVSQTSALDAARAALDAHRRAA